MFIDFRLQRPLAVYLFKAHASLSVPPVRFGCHKQRSRLAAQSKPPVGLTPLCFLSSWNERLTWGQWQKKHQRNKGRSVPTVRVHMDPRLGLSLLFLAYTRARCPWNSICLSKNWLNLFDGKWFKKKKTIGQWNNFLVHVTEDSSGRTDAGSDLVQWPRWCHPGRCHWFDFDGPGFALRLLGVAVSHLMATEVF